MSINRVFKRLYRTILVRLKHIMSFSDEVILCIFIVFVILQADDGEPTAKASSRLTLVQGEFPTNVVEPVSYAFARRRGGGGEFDGALHLTNFRLVLQRTGSGKVLHCFRYSEWFAVAVVSGVLLLHVKKPCTG